MVLVHVGVDDVDSLKGGCTTHFASLLIEELEGKVRFLDYPRLIRLNPGVPWKTRGNGAVGLTFETRDPEQITTLIEDLLKEYVESLSLNFNQPVAIVLVGSVPWRIKSLSLKAISDIVLPETVLKAIKSLKCKLIFYDKTRIRGVVGAASAIGLDLEFGDYTFELLTFRKRDFWGKPRRYNFESVLMFDEKFRNETFLNVDYEVGKALIFPSGSDPVLYGVRGERVEALLEALSIIEVYEPIDRWVIFRSNQGTDMHLKRRSISNLKPYQTCIIEGVVTSNPTVIRGGHVIFKVSNSSGAIDVAAYKPTGRLALECKKLIAGDIVRVGGVVRPSSSKHGLTLNLEKLWILKLAEKYRLENPKCPKCKARMKSAGRNKGFKCPKCKYRSSSIGKVKIVESRELKLGLVTPCLRAFKHLMKPPSRIGREKRRKPEKLVDKWHHP